MTRTLYSSARRLPVPLRTTLWRRVCVRTAIVRPASLRRARYRSGSSTVASAQKSSSASILLFVETSFM